MPPRTKQEAEPRTGPAAPKPKTTIWRYIDIARFKDLMLDRSVSFRQSKDLQDLDACEGRVPDGFWEAVLEMYREQNPGVQMADLEPQIERSKATLEKLRRMLYVSCWIMAKTEDALMWKAYAPGGVAIRTTVEKFKRAEQDGDERLGLWPAKIVYADHWRQLKRRFRTDGMPLHRLFMHTKRRAFTAEREVRFSLNANVPFTPRPGGGWFEPDPAKYGKRLSVKFRNLSWIDEVMIERSIASEENRLRQFTDAHGLKLKVSEV